MLSSPLPAGASARAETIPVAAFTPIINSLVAADCANAADADTVVVAKPGPPGDSSIYEANRRKTKRLLRKVGGARIEAEIR